MRVKVSKQSIGFVFVSLVLLFVVPQVGAESADQGRLRLVPLAPLDRSWILVTAVGGLAFMGLLLFFLWRGRKKRTSLPTPEPVDEPIETISAPEPPSSVEVGLDTSPLLSVPSSQALVLTAGHRTDVGKKRELNEDNLVSQIVKSPSRSGTTPVGLFAVADGMGGHAAGDVASGLAVQVIRQRADHEPLTAFTSGSPQLDTQQWVEDVMRVANEVVHKQRQAAETNMGTTLVMALLIGGAVVVANVGDSRAYRLDEHGITQITVDHSLVERLVATGQITAEEATVHPQRNIIYRTIGDRPEVEIDLFKHHLARGEALMLCSDGLNGMLSDETMWQIWHASASPQEACDRLVDAANEAGGRDNITVVIAQLGVVDSRVP